MCSLLLLAPVVQAQQIDWPVYAGSPQQSKFFEYDQITPANVGQLEVAWQYPVIDQNAYQFSPLIVDGVMYLVARNYSIVALDAVTGRELWVREGFQGITRRGMLYWESEDGSDKRLIITQNDRLKALDAGNGELITSFGSDGEVDLHQNLGVDPAGIRRLQSLNPGILFEDLVLVGSAPGEGYFSPPGHLRAYNVVTGEMAWIFHTIPHPGEYGYETWPKDAWKYVGGVNTWGEITVDPDTGIAYFPLGSPTYDFYGADRIGANLFGNSLLALDARTGKRLWHFQTIHHDIWDYDLSVAPQLLTVEHEGKQVQAVAQSTKQGWLFVFDRLTGMPLWPIEERPVPVSTMPGEQSWPTQPFPTGLPVTARRVLDADNLDMVFTTEAEREAWLDRIEAANTGLYTPITTNETIALPGAVGGTNFGNSASDPGKGILYLQNQNMPAFYRLEEEISVTEGEGATPATFNFRQVIAGQTSYNLYCQTCHGGDRRGGSNGPSLIGLESNISYTELEKVVLQGQGRMPALNHIDENTLTNLLAFLSGGNAMPLQGRGEYPEGLDVPPVRYRSDYGLTDPHVMSPPWSQIMAIDLNTGDMKWNVPLGQDEEASALGFEGTGVPRGAQRLGMVVTSTGLVFSTAKDHSVYAYDAETGAVLWRGDLPMATEGLPAMYVVDGKQYLVVNATTPQTWGRNSREGGLGSSQSPGEGGYVVFALP